MLSIISDIVAQELILIFALVFIVIGFIGAGLFSGWLFLWAKVSKAFHYSYVSGPKNIRSVFILLGCIAGAFPSISQPLTAYTNLQNQVMVWDNGVLRKIDYLPPTDLRIGRSNIAYLDNSRSFKIYYGGGVRTLNNGFTNSFQTSDNLTIFLNAQSLNVFDKGVVKNLSLLTTEYYLGDSLVLFLDGVHNEYKAYYNGSIYPIESYLAGSAIQGVKVSDNIAAYNNYANQFRIFYHGLIQPQEEVSANAFNVGRNTVAYLDASNAFKIFHSGKTITAENFAPTTYTVGDDLVAYVSNDGFFKIFYADSIYNLGFFKPDFQVGDNIVAFKDAGGYFKIFYKGEITQMDSYYPDKYTVQYNSLVYQSQAHVLRMFSAGEVYDVTTAELDSWELSYDVLRYKIGDNFFRVFYSGQEF